MQTVSAFQIEKSGSVISGSLRQLPKDHWREGDVWIRAQYSSVNYKDALAATGRGAILKKFPLIGGIDVAGVVEESADPRFKPNDPVLVTGCGLGESHDGGYSQLVRVRGDWVVPIPHNLDPYKVMALGTAGFTAALAVHRLLVNDQVPEKGPMVVTGAGGGVGNIAIALLSKLGFEVIAVSSKQHRASFLHKLGAHEVVSIDELSLSPKFLASGRFGGAIDNLGGPVLSGLMAATNLWGNIAVIGMAASEKLDASVFPLILRGVSLLGVSSNNCPMALRQNLWQRLASDWQIPGLDEMVSRVVGLSDLGEVFDQMLAGQTFGRIVVDCCGL